MTGKTTIRISDKKASATLWSMLEYHQQRMGAASITEVLRRNADLVELLRCGKYRQEEVELLLQCHFPFVYRRQAPSTLPEDSTRSVNFELSPETHTLLGYHQGLMRASSKMETVRRHTMFLQTLLARMDSNQPLEIVAAMDAMFSHS